MKDSPELTSRYELDRVLSWQGPTRTYQARDPVSGEIVAVKAISLGTVPEAQVLKQRFLATAGVLRTLDHPNLPRLLDFGVTSDAEAYLVFEWIEGTTLDRLGDLAPRQVLPYVLQAIEGLETLALHGLVHLNLAPENLMVTSEGEIKLLGLGGSLFRVDWQSPMVQGGHAGAGIAAPELQLQATAGSALWRADLYALAFVTCALLGAEVDGAGTASPEVRFPEDIGSQLHAPEQLAKALARCLHIEPSQRPVSYSNLGKVLQHSLPRAPRAESVVRDTQVFDVGELAAHEMSVAGAEVEPSGAPGAAEDAGQVSVGETENEESTEILALRSDLEASLGNGVLKEPADLGKEAEIYEGFLELRDDSAPVEIDLSARDESAGAPARGSAEVTPPLGSNETILTPQVPPPVTPERPAAPPGAQTVLTPAARAAPSELPPKPPPAADRGAAPRAEPVAERPAERVVAPPPPRSKTSASERSPAAPPAEAAATRAPATVAAEAGGPSAKPTRRPASPLPPPPSAPSTAGAAKPSAGPASAPPRPVGRPKSSSPPKPQEAPRRRAEAVRAPREAAPAARAVAETPLPRAPAAGSASVKPKGMSSAAAAKKPRLPSDLMKGVVGAARSVSSRPGAKDRRVLVAAGIVAFVAVSSLAAVLLWPGGSTVNEPPVTPVADLPNPMPEPPPTEPESPPAAELPEALQQAVALLDEGKLLEARDRLEEVAAMEEEGALDPRALEAYRAVEEIILRQRAESLIAELTAALKAGDPGQLRQTLGGITAAEEEFLASSSEGRQTLTDARRAREQLDAVQRSLQGDDRMASLNAAFRLAQSFPAFDTALRSRERATAAVEAEVDAMIDQGRLEEAEERLVLLKSMWPERPGIDGKLDTVHQRMESEARFDTLLAAAKAAGGRGRPHEGLRLLDSARPKREYVERFDRERGVLEEQLRGLDAKAPVVRVKSGEIEFRKGSPVIIDLEAEDDYQVAGVTCWVRSASQSDYSAIEATKVDGGSYRVEIDAAVHQDKTLRFWASAKDLSGHEGRLGSAESPVEVKRKRWFR